MKVSELRGHLKKLVEVSEDLPKLDEALARFDDMSLMEFSKFVSNATWPLARKAKPKAPALSEDDLVRRLKSLTSDGGRFDEEMDRLKADTTCTKKHLQAVFNALIDPEVQLPAKLTKPEMVERIKRERRRDANFASS